MEPNPQNGFQPGFSNVSPVPGSIYMRMECIRYLPLRTNPRNPTLRMGSSLTSAMSHLPLAQGDGVELVPREPLVLRKLQQAHGGVGAGGQDEDEGGAVVGVVVGLGQVEGRWLHKLLTQLLHHKVCERQYNLFNRKKVELMDHPSHN